MTNILAEPEVTVRDFVLFRRGECVAQSGSGRGNEEVDGLCVITEGEQGQVSELRVGGCLPYGEE